MSGIHKSWSACWAASDGGQLQTPGEQPVTARLQALPCSYLTWLENMNCLIEAKRPAGRDLKTAPLENEQERRSEIRSGTKKTPEYLNCLLKDAVAS